MFSKESKQKPQFRNMGGGLLGQRKEEVFENPMIDGLTYKIITTSGMSERTYASLNHSRQGVGEIYKVQKAMRLLPELKEKPKKSNEEAQKLRIKGNEAYKAKDLMEALRLYTRAICCAESGTEEIAKAYANRSAVTYGLQEYRNSIDDITRSLSTGKYPEKLTHKLLERRGKCFLALGQYKSASEDFKQLTTLLLQSEIDADKVDSLKGYLDLIAECMGKQDIPEKQTLRPPKLTHKPSPHIQSASSAVDIRYSPKMGRHIVATVDIAPGDILAIEKPFASSLKRGCWDLFCDYCKKRCHSSIPCPSCTYVVFCSEPCRETSWAEYHSVECDLLHHLIHLGCEGKTYMLAVRTLLKATKVGENLQVFIDDYLNETKSDISCKPEKKGFVNGTFRSDDYRTIHTLITHMEDRPQSDLVLITADLSSLIHVLKEATTFFVHTDSYVPSSALFKPVSDLQVNHIVAADLLMRYMLVATYNAHGIGEIRWKQEGKALTAVVQETGSALYSFFSLLNHSCDPDITLLHYNNSDTLIMFATKPISKGQEIFTKYRFDYGKQDKLGRQASLRESYYFTCECIACIEDWPLLGDLPDVNPELISPRAKRHHVRELIESCAHVFKISKEVLMCTVMTEDQFRSVIKHLTLLHKYMKRPLKNYYACQNALIDHLQFSYNPCIFKALKVL